MDNFGCLRTTVAGQRVVKINKTRTGTSLNPQNQWIYTYYAYDANGQVMATYNITLSASLNTVTLDDQHIYGAARLGMKKPNILLYDNAPISYAPSEITQNTLGETYFEITNYLGNVNAVITDRKTYAGIGATSLYEAVVISTSDYYPFGMEMPGRSTNSGTYKFGYNGMEIDKEVSGNGNSYTTEFRQYDPRLGRWKSLDSLMDYFPDQSPYVSFDNNPVVFNDPNGDCPWCAVFDYAWQVSANLIEGKSGYDAFIGDVDFVSVAVSAIPGGKGIMKAVKIAGEIYSAGTENTVNKGVRVKSKSEIIAGVATKYISKKMVKGLKKISSEKIYKKVSKMTAKYVKKANNQSAKLKQKPGHKGASGKLNQYENKLNSLRKAEVLSKSANKTFGNLDKNQWKAIEVNIEKGLESTIKPIGNPNDAKDQNNTNTSISSPWHYVEGSFKSTGKKDEYTWEEKRTLDGGNTETHIRTGSSNEFLKDPNVQENKK